MNDEPSEWRSFGDPTTAQPDPSAAPSTAGPGHTARAGGSDLGSARSHRNAWLAVGMTVVTAVLALGLFISTITVAGTAHPSQVVIAARNDAGASAPARLSVGIAPASVRPSGGGLVVDVEGAVLSPGLQHLAAGARLGDAIVSAGGYSARADLAAAALTLNLAELMTDGAKVRVPVLGEGGPVSPVDGGGTVPAPTATGAGTGPVDLNHADEPTLESLPGIGPVTAAKIIAARAGGLFVSLDDVVARKALSVSVVDKIRALVTLNP